jgi:hypothetical protein
VLRKAGELRIGTGACQNLGVAGSDDTTALALERARNNGSTAASGPGVDDLIHEINELFR